MAIFVSHSVNDVESPVFGLLRGDLERMRYSVWFDQKLIGGQSWWDEILDQIRRCDLLVFAFSRHAIKSEACLAELGYALALHRPVLPVKLAELSDWEIPQSIARV